MKPHQHKHPPIDFDTGPQYVSTYNITDDTWTIQITRGALLPGGTQITITNEQYHRFLQWYSGEGGALIQETLSDLSDAERESLLTGISPTEWTKIFGPEE